MGVSQVLSMIVTHILECAYMEEISIGVILGMDPGDIVHIIVSTHQVFYNCPYHCLDIVV